MFSAYLRGEAYLQLGDGKSAALEFQKILSHRGIVGSSLHGALAYLGLARARALAGDVEGSREAYGELFSLWKAADPDTPILLQAKAEYSKLH